MSSNWFRIPGTRSQSSLTSGLESDAGLHDGSFAVEVAVSGVFDVCACADVRVIVGFGSSRAGMVGAPLEYVTAACTDR